MTACARSFCAQLQAAIVLLLARLRVALVADLVALARLARAMTYVVARLRKLFADRRAACVVAGMC